MADKPRFRVQAGDVSGVTTRGQISLDSFQNFAAQLGIGTSNQMSSAGYGFNPISRNRTLLEWAYRGNWVAGIAIDAVAEDMTRAGIEIMSSQLTSQEIAELQAAMKRMRFWQSLCDTIRWGRLYGGAIGIMMIEGQDPSTPLRPATIGRGQFKGIYPMDRWMVDTAFAPDQLVKAMGPHLGLPPYYTPMGSMPLFANEKIHYTRVVRTIGYTLPYQQAQTEMGWGISILERLYDRLIAFDSTTQGAAQLVNKAHLRTISIDKLRELIAFGGTAAQAVQAQMQFIRLFQTNEGITLLDASDKFEAHQYAFSGLGDMMLQFAQQVAGALQIPLVRLFGQSPAGMNATGESDFRNYYDGINAHQEADLRDPVEVCLQLLCLSTLGKPLPLDTEFKFKSLWQLNPMERSETAKSTTESVLSGFDSGLVPAHVALEELRTHSSMTGMWTSITDEEIEAARNAPPVPGGMGLGGAFGGETAGAAPLPGQENEVDGSVPLALPPSPAPTPPEVADPTSGLMPSDEDMPGDDDDGMEPGPVTKVDIYLTNGGEVDVERTMIQ